MKENIIDLVNDESIDMIVLAVDNKNNNAVTWHRCDKNADQTMNMIEILHKCTSFDLKDNKNENNETARSLFDAMMNFASNVCANDTIPLNMFINAVNTYKEQIKEYKESGEN